jgi:hypothetical protein
VLIKSQESGLALPHAPGFGPGGAWPPAQTEWLPLRWQVFAREASNLGTAIGWMLFVANPPNISDNTSFEEFCGNPACLNSTVEFTYSRPKLSVKLPCGEEGAMTFGLSSISEFERNARGVKVSVTGGVPRPGIPTRLWKGASRPQQIQQLVHSVRWRREDPPTQLPPAATYEMTHTATIGLSTEHSQALAKSLGLDIGGRAPGLQTKLSQGLQQQFGFKLNITETTEVSKKLTLTNPNSDRYRAFSLWQMDHLLAAKVLDLPIKFHVPKAEGIFTWWHPHWTLCDQVQFTVSNEPFITYADINYP